VELYVFMAWFLGKHRDKFTSLFWYIIKMLAGAEYAWA
jgi:hypothetical protein